MMVTDLEFVNIKALLKINSCIRKAEKYAFNTFSARGLVFLGENILPHEIIREFISISNSAPINSDLLERVNRFYENVVFTDIVSRESIATPLEITSELEVYPIN